MKWHSILLIIRPANVVTAISDILAGIAIVGLFMPNIFSNSLILDILLLVLSTSCLYAGGIVFNDIFDYPKDKINRPERVIPSNRLSLSEAKKLGLLLFIIGIGTAFLVSVFSGIIAIAICLCALSYDKYAKHHTVLGPINMGLCRGLNLILGMSLASDLELNFYFIAIMPFIFVSAITLTAQKETKGKNKIAIVIAMVLDALIVLGFWLMHKNFDFLINNALIFIALWYGINTYAKVNAIVHNKPKLIMKAVKVAVLSLILLNACYVAGFCSVYMAILVIGLLPISLFLAKKFPVT